MYMIHEPCGAELTIVEHNGEPEVQGADDGLCWECGLPVTEEEIRAEWEDQADVMDFTEADR